MTYKDAAYPMHEEWIPELEQLCREHEITEDNVRIIFGFWN